MRQIREFIVKPTGMSGDWHFCMILVESLNPNMTDELVPVTYFQSESCASPLMHIYLCITFLSPLAILSIQLLGEGTAVVVLKQ